jgi:hypothetical protein
VKLVAAVLVALAVSASAQGGIYSPDEAFNFEIDADGFAKPIQYASGFELLVADVRDVGVPVNPLTAKYQDRVRQRREKGVAALTPVELAGFTADLIRLNKPDEALNILQPIARDPRRGGFLAYAHLARAHAGRNEWREAYEQQQMAVRYSEFPTEFGRLTKPQLAWLKRVEREYYLPFLAHRAEEAQRGRRDHLREDVDALFPAAIPPKKVDDPVHFVGEDGAYMAGAIADRERKKLPKDAIAIVQQLLLWHPKDARLYWLLGELYNAEGDVETAAKLLDACTFNMGYSNPMVIEHRRALQSAADAMAVARAEQTARMKKADEDEAERQAQSERDYKKRFWWIVAMGVALGVLLVYYQFREVIRRLRRGRGA